MSIRDLVDDAAFLQAGGRYLGALSILLIAIAASSRKTFPKGITKSRTHPNDLMRDREAFTRFLDEQFYSLYVGESYGEHRDVSGFPVEFNGSRVPLAELLYEHYRNNLVHEGKLPHNAKFIAPDRDFPLPPGATRLAFPGSGTTVALDYDLLDILIRAIAYAPCNGEAFGTEHDTLRPMDGVDPADFRDRIHTRYGVTPGRLRVLMRVVFVLTPSKITAASDSEVRAQFAELVEDGQIDDGNVFDLWSVGVTDRAGVLQPVGVAALRDVAAAYARVPSWVEPSP